MDFSLSGDQQDLAALSRRILGDKVTVEVLRRVEAADARFDREIWEALAHAGLVGIGLPEDLGGGGGGLLETCLVLEEVGRSLAPVPLLASAVAGALPIAEFGDSAQQQAWVRPAADGTRILTAALSEPANGDPLQPATRAQPDGDGWRLDGVKTTVPAGTIADLLVVPAAVGDRVGLFLVEPSTPGVTITPQRLTTRDSAGYVEFHHARLDAGALLGSLDEGRRILEWLVERVTVGLCAQQLGVIEQALDETAAYAKSRVQFERPIATFQAVGHRCADAYIDVEAARLTLWQALWRLSSGLPARTEVEVAKFWAAEAGHRVAHTAVHIHGGMGVAVEHTTHRYFLWAKQAEFMLGGASEQLVRLGDELAAGAPL